MAWAIDEGDVSNQQQGGIAPRSGALRAVFLLRAEGLVTLRRLASRAFIKLRVGITELDCDVSESLFVVTHSL